MAEGLLGFFALVSQNDLLSGFLENSTYDELVEIDLENGRCRNLHHVEGKYFVPVASGSYCEMYDYTLDNIIHPDDRDIFAQFMDPDTVAERLASSEIPGALSARYRYRLQGGGWCWTEQVLIGDGRQGLPAGIARMYIFDIENLMSRKQGKCSSVYPRFSYDTNTLTGLIVEKSFQERADILLETGAYSQWCFISIDLDHFKLFNEWHGREAGDFLLADIGAHLNESVGQVGGLAAYCGQDNFCLFYPFDRSLIDELFDSLCSIIAERGSAGGFMPVFGISLVQENLTSMELLDQASTAVSIAKSDFRKRICLFRQPMRERKEREYRIIYDFLQGLDSGEIFFQLQPQCRMSTGKIVGAEALVRWRKADGTSVSPFDFVPALEHHGFITNLDCYIWEEVCIWLRSWIDAGHDPLPISVNVSQVDFYVIDVPEHLERLVAEYELDPKLLKVEITESAYVDSTAAVHDAARQLRERGFFVLMDDFGSGYSSLNTLRELPVDAIKLDAQFLRFNKDEGHKGVRILESVISMAKSLAMPIICEGVETEEQTRFLEGQGCRYVQGYKFYRPMDVDNFEEIIRHVDNVDMRGLVLKRNEQFHVRELFDEYVYSDSMLNSILGAVALYSWHGDDVDIVRFNEQFYETIESPRFHDLLEGIQRLMPSSERPKLYALLHEAEANELNGSSGMLNFLRDGGSTNRYLFHFYYLGKVDGNKRFYGSVRDITELTELQGEMRLIKRFSSDSVVFARRRAGVWKFSVVVHGLAGVLGLNFEELQRELDDGSFFERVDREAVQDLKDVMDKPGPAGVSGQMNVLTASGERVDLGMKADAVNDEQVNVEYIIVFRRA